MKDILMSKGKVLIAAPVHPVLTDGLEACGYECAMHVDITQAAAPVLIQDCTGVITSTRLQLDKALLDTAPELKWIGRMGSGMEVVDVQYAVEKGVVCYSSPEGNRNAVAEHALGMLLSLVRKIGTSNNEIKSGRWLREENRGTELEGKTIGIIGFGNTGRALAQKLRGFDMCILAHDKYQWDDMPVYVINCREPEQLFRDADIVSFHVPLQDDTVHYFNEAFIDKMNKPFILINTSRGKVVDGKALLKGLQSGKIIGACLDVWEEEPLARMEGESKEVFNALLAMPQVIITPHIAGYTNEALYKMSAVLLQKICG